MANKMLIDASHPEETRVAVVRGNRIEEFDFESQEKKQLRGNIYLAKVTRVEPSLQAAFIDYGGKRHGFLAFSEIHPDYYQIPVADRQALLEAEAAEARASREAEEAQDEIEDASDTGEEAQADRPKRRSRRRSSRKANAEKASADQEAGEEIQETADESSAEAEVDAKPSKTDNSPEDAPADQVEAVAAENSEEAPEEEVKPKRRATRRKTKASTAKAAAAEPDAEETPDQETPDTADDDSSDGPTTMAAMVETDSISEPLPGEEEEPENDAATEEDAVVEASESAEEEKPKKRRTSRTRRKKAEPVEESSEGEVAAEAAKEPAGEAQASEESAEPEKPAEEVKEKPKRRSRRKKAPVAADADADQEKSDQGEETASDDTDDAENTDEENVESVGREQDDALEEASSPRRTRKQYKIQEVIKRRQILLVQVVKEERGNKGAALTTYLSLAGRYSVLMPNTARGGGISRKITNAADRKRLKAIASELDVPEGMGVILRTAGASRTEVEINRDFQYLMRLWEQVRSLTLSSTAPCLVYEEGSLIKRSIRDLYDKDTGEILVSGERGFEEAHEFMGMLMPNRLKKVKLYKDSQAIFAKHGVESQLENMVSPQVTLKSGGYLVMNQTEALVAVDVNSGRATREHSIENTALQTNLEAAEEVARQLRLRDLAGLIVIDFIDMEERRNNRAVEKKLKDCLKNDRARIQVGRISHFGLLEMSRQRIRASVLESTMDVCPHCAGVGYVRSESAIALHVFRALEEHVSRHKKWDVTVRTTPDIAVHLLNYKRAALLDLERKYRIQIVITGDVSMHGQQFEIEKGERAKPTNDQAAIGYDGDSATEEVEKSPAESDENEGRGRKRGRRRNRKESPDDTGDTETVSSTAEPAIAENAGAEKSENDEEQPKKRRRGNRGGRRRKSAAAISEGETVPENTEAEGDAADQPLADETEVAAPQSAATEVTAEQPEEKPARRSTRRKKAPISPPAPEVETVAEAVPSETVAEPIQSEEAKPKRRTTRRKAVAEEPAVAMAEAAEESAPATPEEPVTAETEAKSKRSGWWSRGGGFF